MNTNNKINDLIIDKIINIKESYFYNIRFSRSLFDQIHKLFKKIISLFNSYNDEGYQKYLQKLHMFIGKYGNV